MEGETAETNVNPGDARAELRKYFGKNYEAAFKKENVERWLKDLGLVLCKRDIHDGAAKMAEYLMDVKGYSTGEDFVTGEQADIEEARTNAGIELSDVSTRSIHRKPIRKIFYRLFEVFNSVKYSMGYFVKYNYNRIRKIFY